MSNDSVFPGDARTSSACVSISLLPKTEYASVSCCHALEHSLPGVARKVLTLVPDGRAYASLQVAQRHALGHVCSTSVGRIRYYVSLLAVSFLLRLSGQSFLREEHILMWVIWR